MMILMIKLLLMFWKRAKEKHARIQCSRRGSSEQKDNAKRCQPDLSPKSPGSVRRGSGIRRRGKRCRGRPRKISFSGASSLSASKAVQEDNVDIAERFENVTPISAPTIRLAPARPRSSATVRL
ncbi:hypothetical protein OSTOST_17575 [Ostertagia ostertagi]